MTTTKGFSVTQFFVSAVVASAVIGAFAGIASAAVTNNSGLGVSVDVGVNGAALVRGAQVTAVSDTQVDAKTSWGDAVLNWVVKTDADTQYAGKNDKDSTRADIAVGDTISFRGALDQALSGLVVKAKTVKNWSKGEIKSRVNGSVSSINSSLNSFVIVRGNSTTTVETNSSTKFTKDGDAASFADITLNAKVNVQGAYNASSTVVTATAVEIKTDNDNDHNNGRGWLHLKGWLKFWNR